MDKNFSFNGGKTHFLVSYISNPKERKRVLSTMIIASALFLLGFFVVTYFYQQWLVVDSRAYKGIFKEIGSIAQIGFFAVISIYPVFFLLKWKFLKRKMWGKFLLKMILPLMARLVRQWHVPMAIVSVAIVLIHGYMAILKEFKWDFTYLSGITSSLVLFPLMFMGMKRYKRDDKKWHFNLAIVFLILFMVHASFA